MQTTSGRLLIPGVSGQDGAYLADLLLRKGFTVHGTSLDKMGYPGQRAPGGFLATIV